jgi:hypothetical protein
MPQKYRPGEKVPISGIYRIIHDPLHEPEHEHEVVCIAGKRFPRCHKCGHTHFEQVHGALRVESHDDFKLPSKPQRRSHRKGGLVTIILGLFVVGLIGASFIRFAPALAAVPWIVSFAKLFLFPDPVHEDAERVLIHFFNEVGIAFVVAVILGACFEIFMRRREERQHHKHIEEIEKSVFSSLLGYLTPTTISDEIRRVFEHKIMRSNLDVKFSFSNAPADLLALDPSLLLVTVKIEYDLVNLTTKPTSYTVDHGFEPILALDSDHNRFIRLKITRGRDNPLFWTYGLTNKDVKFKSSKPCIRNLEVRDFIELGPGIERGSANEDPVHVHLEYQVVRRQRDQDSWMTWLPADRLDVRTKVDPESSLNLDFHLEETHPIKFEETNSSATDRKWSLPSYEVERNGEKEAVSIAVLPYQGFTLYWFPRGSTCESRAPAT